jgi:chloramphenicol 3-O phosphotransferase
LSGVIFLHGPSSSGKSTLARVLQDRLETAFWHYSIDHLRDSGILPSVRIARGDFPWSDLRERFFDGFHRSVAAFADAGNDVILEHILDTPGWREQLSSLLEPHDVLFVGLRCSLAELRRRERTRGNRRPGSAEADYHVVHQDLDYDVEIDTEKDLDTNARIVISAWGKPRSRSAFFCM